MCRAWKAKFKYLDFPKESIPNGACLKNHGSSKSQSPGSGRTFRSPVARSVITRTPSPRDARSGLLLGTIPKGQESDLRLAGEDRGTS